MILARFRYEAALLGLICGAGCAQGQGYPFSQRATVSQMVAFTEISVAYGRPVARGRMLFGDTGVVKWEQAWNPGADSATRIAVSHPIEFEGREIQAGEYSLWVIPRASAPWTVILSSAAHVFHTPYPGESQDAVRLEIPPERGSHMESLAIYFPTVVSENAVMRIHWGETILPIRIRSTYRPPP